MGGHTQFFEKKTLAEAVKSVAYYQEKFEKKYGLYMRYVNLSWDRRDWKWRGQMRFSK